MVEEVKGQPKSLVLKLAEITKEITRIPKNGFNNYHNYAYATESDIKDVVRKPMAERNIMIFSDEIGREVVEVTTKNGKKEFLTTIHKIYYIEDGDSGEVRSFKATGTGQDSGDKGQYKAETGALKYVLTNLFMIPTGDDPEVDGKPLQPGKEMQPDMGHGDIPKLDTFKLDIARGKLLEFATSQGAEYEFVEQQIADYLGINPQLENLSEDEFGKLMNYLREKLDEVAIENKQPRQSGRKWGRER